MKDPYKAVRRVLKAHDAKAIGDGCWAYVYAHSEDDKVIKTGKTGNNIGYLSYIEELSKQRRHNPNTPLIHSLTIYENAEGYSEFVLIMERLEHWNCKTAKFKALFEDLQAALHDKKAIVVPRDLREALTIVRRAQQASGNPFDLAAFNTMIRGDTLVITDPIWN